MDEKQVQSDPTLPQMHVYGNREIPHGIGQQKFPRPNAALIINSRRGLIPNTGTITGKVSLLAKRISNQNLVR
jgi:hypothetical protein